MPSAVKSSGLRKLLLNPARERRVPFTRSEKHEAHIDSFRKAQLDRIKHVREVIRLIAKQDRADLRHSPHFSIGDPRFFKEVFEIKRHIDYDGFTHKQKVLLNRALDRAVAKAKGRAN